MSLTYVVTLANWASGKYGDVAESPINSLTDSLDGDTREFSDPPLVSRRIRGKPQQTRGSAT